jgi:hypothetical protein
MIALYFFFDSANTKGKKKVWGMEAANLGGVADRGLPDCRHLCVWLAYIRN